MLKVNFFKKIDQFVRRWNHQRIDYFRYFKLKISLILSNKLFAYKKNNQKLEFANSNKKIFCVLRLDNKLGDSIVSTGFLFSLKQSFPEFKIVVFSGASASFVYKNLIFVDEVVVVKKGFASAIKAYWKYRQYLFTAVINTSHILTPEVVFLVSLFKAEKKISFLNQQFKIFSDWVSYNTNSEHITARYEKILQILSATHIDLRYHLRFVTLDPDLPEMKKLSDIENQALSLILMNPFAGAKLRNFNKVKVFQLVQALLQADDSRIILSPANSDDMNILSRWIQEFNQEFSDHFSSERWICFPENTSLEFNLTLASKADLIITPDTAFVHIASAFQKNLVAVYRVDDEFEKNSVIWAPYQACFKIVYADQSPSSDSQFDREDINHFSVEKVVQAVSDLLG